MTTFVKPLKLRVSLKLSQRWKSRRQFSSSRQRKSKRRLNHSKLSKRRTRLWWRLHRIIFLSCISWKTISN